MNETTPRRYFAASNSCLGFRNYYGDLFTDTRTDRLYIIKGGSGTGKSHLMRQIAQAAHARGYAVDYYHCSSDPSSLDGVLIIGKDECFGIVDGTSPHTVEPTVPGARENIIDLGQFWDQSLLFKQKNEIMALSSKKSSAYRPPRPSGRQSKKRLIWSACSPSTMPTPIILRLSMRSIWAIPILSSPLALTKAGWM